MNVIVVKHRSLHPIGVGVLSFMLPFHSVISQGMTVEEVFSTELSRGHK